MGQFTTLLLHPSTRTARVLVALLRIFPCVLIECVPVTLPCLSHKLSSLSPLSPSMPREGNVFHLATSGDDGKVKIIMITGEELNNPDYEERPDPPQGLDAVIPFFFKGAGIPRPHKKKKEGENAENAATSAEGDAPPTKEADVEAAMMVGEEDDEFVEEGEFDDEEEEEEEVEDKFVHLDLHS